MPLTRGQVSDLGDNDINTLNADSVVPVAQATLDAIASTLGKLHAIADQYTAGFLGEYEATLDLILANQP